MPAPLYGIDCFMSTKEKMGSSDTTFLRMKGLKRITGELGITDSSIIIKSKWARSVTSMPKN